MQTDVITAKMLEECFGKGSGKEADAVLSYFECVKREIGDLGCIFVPCLGYFEPMFLIAWRKWKRKRIGLRDVDAVGRGAVIELRNSGCDEEKYDYYIKNFGLEKYV